MKRLFIHLPDFDNFWKKAKLDDQDLLEFQTHLLENPKSGVVIKETNGIRKIRWKKKSSGIRVFYVDMEEYEILFLISLLEKNDQENLSKSKLKILGQLTLELKDSIKRRRKK